MNSKKYRHAPDFAVYSHSRGLREYAEMRALLAAGLSELGFGVVESDEARGFARGARRHVVVAPHEFFHSVRGRSLARSMPEGLIVYLTDLPRTPAHRLSEEFLSRCLAVWSLEKEAAACAAASGYRSSHVPLGYAGASGLFKKGTLPRWNRRSAAIFYQGELTARLSRFFARSAQPLSEFPCRLIFNEDVAQARPSWPAVTGVSRIALALHREPVRRNAWRSSVLHGFGQGALVVAEPGAVGAPFLAGRDYLEAPLEKIPEVLKGLRSPRGAAGAAKTAACGARTLRKSFRMASLLAPAIDALDDPAPCPQLVAGLSYDTGEAPFETLLRGVRAGRAPRATIGITLKNYRRFIVQALESVRRQTEAAFDLIVVDDGSSDGSAAAAKRWLQRHGGRFRRFELLRAKPSVGLARARNATFSRARTPYVFVLDADNRLFPRCLKTLADAAQSSGAGFTYSYLRRFGEEEALKNTASWDGEFLRRGFSYDAMALVRRKLWKKIGGYRFGGVQGWEDFDFWLRAAASGGRGGLVPEILAEYRVHIGSMNHSETEPGFWRVAEIFKKEFGVAFQESPKSGLERVLFRLLASDRGGKTEPQSEALRTLSDLIPEPVEGLR